MGDRIIFHVDVNSAFLSWEAVYRLKHLGGELDLRSIPSAVGGDSGKRHGIILAKSVPAKRYRIKTGEAVWEALRKCPGLALVPPNYNLYQKSSDAFVKILLEYTKKVERYSIDECFMDMTGTEALFGEPKKAAEAIKDRIFKELGFTVNIGVGNNKLLAKMASDFEKPDRVHTLFVEEIREKMWPLPAEDLFFVGRATRKKLSDLGVRTIGQLAKVEPELLRSHLHKHGEVLWKFANGIDVSLVEEVPPANKGYGNSTTTPFDVTDEETAGKVLLSLAETVCARLREDRVKARVIAVSIRDCYFHDSAHQTTLISPSDITAEVCGAARRLFAEAWDGTPVRHLGIHTGEIVKEESRQMGLLDVADYEKLGRLDRAVDDIRKRYGVDSVKRAVFLNSPFDHMSGGISREKRAVDYSHIEIE